MFVCVCRYNIVEKSFKKIIRVDSRQALTFMQFSNLGWSKKKKKKWTLICFWLLEMSYKWSLRIASISHIWSSFKDQSFSISYSWSKAKIELWKKKSPFFFCVRLNKYTFIFFLHLFDGKLNMEGMNDTLLLCCVLFVSVWRRSWQRKEGIKVDITNEQLLHVMSLMWCQLWSLQKVLSGC